MFCENCGIKLGPYWDKTTCPFCDSPLNAQPPGYRHSTATALTQTESVQAPTAKGVRVIDCQIRIIDIDIPFSSMLVLILKWMVALFVIGTVPFVFLLALLRSQLIQLR